MINTLQEIPQDLKNISLDFKELYYIGNINLLQKRKVSIVGTRRPTAYTKQITHDISTKLSKRDICIVSGAAMGVDTIAHKAANTNNTIAVVANGLNIRYPAVNKNLIADIEQNGLMLSVFKEGHRARPYNFVQRNELVVALGEVLIVSEADLKSGSLTSVEFAKKLNKKIYTIPHRLGESLGTNELVKKGIAEVIYDVEEFVNSFGEIKQNSNKFLEYCSTHPTYDEAMAKYGEKVFEAEILGDIFVENGRVYIS